MSFELSHNLSDPEVRQALRRARQERSEVFHAVFSGFTGLFQLSDNLKRKSFSKEEREAPYRVAACG